MGLAVVADVETPNHPLAAACCSTEANREQGSAKLPLSPHWEQFSEKTAGNTQGQARQGSEQPDETEDVPAHCKGVGPDGL